MYIDIIDANVNIILNIPTYEILFDMVYKYNGSNRIKIILNWSKIKNNILLDGIFFWYIILFVESFFINNAGIIQPFVKVEKLDDNTINKVMNVNFFGPVHLIRYFMEDLTKDRTEQYIVNVSSMGGFFPFPGQTIYGASKAALKIFTEGLYAELEKTNVRVMIVLPGAMNTNITTNSNVEINTSKEESNFKMLEADVAAFKIIEGIEKNKFKLFLGQDAKFLRFLYKINSKTAISFINKKMNVNK